MSRVGCSCCMSSVCSPPQTMNQNTKTPLEKTFCSPCLFFKKWVLFRHTCDIIGMTDDVLFIHPHQHKRLMMDLRFLCYLGNAFITRANLVYFLLLLVVVQPKSLSNGNSVRSGVTKVSGSSWGRQNSPNFPGKRFHTRSSSAVFILTRVSKVPG